MRSASRLTAAAFGIFAGFSGIQHGFYEVLQGNVRPSGVMINSFGPQCQPEKVWHACEPAMTLIPDFFWAGILAMMVGLIALIWAVAFVQRRNGRVILVLLSIAQLLVGGGLIPPLIGIAAGVVGTRINTPFPWWRAHLAGKTLGFLATVWPWSLAVFVVWTSMLYPVGYFYGDFLMKNGYLILPLVLGPLLLTIPAAFARDIRQGDRRAAA